MTQPTFPPNEPPPRTTVRLVGRSPIVWRTTYEGSEILAKCDALVPCVQCEDLDALVQVIAETMDVFFRGMVEDGKLGSFLADRGWKIQGDLPSTENVESLTFRAPVSVQIPLWP